MGIADLLIIALATWRLAYMVTKETGPYRIFERIRQQHPLGGLTTCIYCSSVWAAAGLMAVYALGGAIVVQWLAIAGAALMLASYTGVGHD